MPDAILEHEQNTRPPGRPAARGKRADLECTQCQRRFSKPEHLARHRRVHSGVKPHKCTHLGCEKAFSRIDALGRHVKMHDKPEHAHQTSGQSGQPAAIPDNDNVLDIVTPLPMLANTQRPGGHNRMDLASASSWGAVDEAPAGDWPAMSSMWTDIDDLFAILTSDAHTTQMAQPGHAIPDPAGPAAAFDVGDDGHHARGHPDHARQAVQSLSSLLQDFSFDLAREVEGTGVTADFLDACLGCFFRHFHPVFPVIHEPTFAVRDCTPSLLLTMIALGSLFLAAEGATAKGEALWKVAHAAIVTSWQRLVASHPPPPGNSPPARPGKQLVLTSLLGQAYAVLSVNRSLKLTSQALRGLGFYWARYGESPSVDPLEKCGEASSSDTSLNISQKWKTWADREVERRAVLAHYILDGLISHSSGLPNGARHTTNNMTPPCSDEAFEAQTAEEWFSLISHESQSSGMTFRELLLQLFVFDVEPPRVLWSHLSVPVVMEALQSLVTETREAGGPSVGLPSQSDISQALWRLFDSQINHSFQPTVNSLDLSIRWHVICIGLCADPTSLLHGLSRKEAAMQDYRSGKSATLNDQTPCLDRWQTSHLARRALLHALAAIDLVHRLPLGNMHALHIPLSLSVIGTIIIAIHAIGKSKIRLPHDICWKSVCNLDSSPQETDVTATTYFIHHGVPPNTSKSQLQNLTVAMNSLHSIQALRMTTWGITGGLEERLDRLLQARLQIG